ncbi:hypothetical protein DEO72_LG6g1319 [Vigna unguiculata]|uniref:Uncharacterized protein n=1 Tax=Vigna unguiculata TaxID=3917 RepID=A0A4D6M5N9_VIGUN|nr:hypothetical protein DEO72_LG6g1319 [Vigna unguiculata]
MCVLQLWRAKLDGEKMEGLCGCWWLPACVLVVVFATSARTEKMVALSRFRSAAVLVVAADGVALVVLRRRAGRKRLPAAV